jgi:GTP cyclohydrolase I
LLPSYGTIEVITGLGLIVQLVQALAHRLQTQDFLVRDIALTIRERIKAMGVFMRSRTDHL